MLNAMGLHQKLKQLLAPQQLVVIGGQIAAQAIRECDRLGFGGEIWPVNPKAKDLEGRPCFKSVDALPSAPDAAFIAVQNQITIESVRKLATRRTAGCVCYAAGFAEAGEQGQALQQDLVEAARGMALVGPNCYGVLNYLDGVALWPDTNGGNRVERGVALISQSGNIALNMTSEDRSVPLAYVISVGNQAVCGIDDYVSVLLDDPRVSAIGLVIEALTDVAAFTRAAIKALDQGIPLIALKIGSSELGARATLSHTSSVAGSKELYQALFDRVGVIQAHSLSGLMETLKLIHVCGPLTGNRIASMSCSGGEAALVADAAIRLGLCFPPLTPTQRKRLDRILSWYATASNPLDYNTAIWGDRPSLTAMCTTMLEGAIDAGILIVDYPRPGCTGIEGWDAVVDALTDAHERTGTTAIALSTLSELLPADRRETLASKGIAPLQGLEDGLCAVAGAAWYGVTRERLRNTQQAADLVLAGPTATPHAVTTLDEFTSKSKLKEFGIAIPNGRLVDAGDAVQAACDLGFPVAVKAISPDLPHKTEAGGVALGLHSGEAVAEAVSRMHRTIAGQVKSVRFLVEHMIHAPVVELIIGVKHDPQFGMALVVGSGGVFVEMLQDVCTLLLPTDRETVRRAIRGLKAGRLISGYRGRKAGDENAAVDCVLAVAGLAGAHRGRLLELDINPLFVLPEGQGVVAVDALIRMGEDQSR